MDDDLVSLPDEPIKGIGAFRVSARGQLSLPAEIRRRWGIETGGAVEIVDLGSSVMLVPRGEGALWRAIREAIPPDDYKQMVDEIGSDDPDLASR